LLSIRALGQEAVDKTSIPTIHVSGEAAVTAKPDQAEIDVGVVTQAQTAQGAADRNAQQLAKVLDELRSILGANAELRTISYSVTPDYRYPREGDKPAITGYTATNVVRVVINDLAQLGRVIDLATATGANSVRRLQFTLKSDRALQARALKEAAADARDHAEALASALGLRIVRVLSVRESGPVTRPFSETLMSRAESAAIPTPVEAGTIEVRASIALTFEVSPK
jgi:uncharacterized protein YggE